MSSHEAMTKLRQTSVIDRAALAEILLMLGRFEDLVSALLGRRPVQLPLSCAADEANALSAASIFDSTRRAANLASLVWVLPLLTASPIWNCHRQMSGSSVAAMVYWMSL